MLSPETKLRRDAISFGAWRKRAHKTETLSDRIKFVHAETALGMAAQKFFEANEKELRREKRRGDKS
jgi:hypothetical protein